MCCFYNSVTQINTTPLTVTHTITCQVLVFSRIPALSMESISSNRCLFLSTIQLFVMFPEGIFIVLHSHDCCNPAGNDLSVNKAKNPDCFHVKTLRCAPKKVILIYWSVFCLVLIYACTCYVKHI